jgi:undecaprenyl-diphosphatase
MLDDVDYSQIITVWDSWINSHISMIWNPILNKIMILVSAVFSPGIIIAVSSGICLYLFLNKRKNYFILWILSLLSGLSYMFIKELVQRARPENFLVQNSGYSFPSGHATLAIIFFSLILYTFKDKIQNLTIKELFIGLNVFMILLVGFSRIYLGVHWLSDIIAGFGLGLFCVSFYVLIIKIIKSIKNKRNSRVTN